MDYGIIIAVSAGTVAIVGVMMSLMFWVRTESNSLRGEAKEDRAETRNLVKSLEIFTRDNLAAIREEMKDFHYQLLEIEKGRHEKGS